VPQAFPATRISTSATDLRSLSRVPRYNSRF
jgi:hypothetical protein